MHFLNIMVSGSGELHLIDWMNARIAPPVFDYARTCVILKEFSEEALRLYESTVLPDLKELRISEPDFIDAVEVCTIVRAREKA